MFQRRVNQLLNDDNTAGTGGVLGNFTSDQFSSDSYATGDARIPKALGKVQRRSKKKRKSKKS